MIRTGVPRLPVRQAQPGHSRSPDASLAGGVCIHFNVNYNVQLPFPAKRRQHFLFYDGAKIKMEISSLRKPQGLFLAGAILRLVLFYAFPGLPELVAGRVEVSTPVNSFKRCLYPEHSWTYGGY